LNTLKILFCTDGIFPYAVGGMQRHSKLLIEELAKNVGVEIVVVHPHKEKIFTSYNNVSEISLPGINTNKNYLLECYKYSQKVYQIILNHPNHVVYSQGLSVWYKIAHIKNKVIVNPHGLEPFQAIGIKAKLTAIPFKIIFKYLFKHADVVISLGGKLTDILQTAISDKSKIRVLPNAVNLPDNINPKNFSKKLHFLFVGRFEYNKGIFYLLNAIEQYSNTHKSNDFTIIFAGKGPLYAQCIKKYSHLPQVKFLGYVDDNKLNELYRQCHIFVLPTLFEGMPTVVMEAMSYGMPVIVSDVGATAQLVNIDNGFLIPPANIDALVEAIKAILNKQPDELTQMGVNSINKIKYNYTWELVAQKHLDLFHELFKKSL
jgi:glycosyltransferase involved in cell wall biosynthesis